MGLVVTGISQSGDITAIEARLKAAGLPLDAVQLIGPDDSTQGSASARGIIGGGGIMGGGSGTGVPGVTSGVPTSGGTGTSFFRNEALGDRLGDLEIPDDQVQNYVDALHAGRSVVAYFAKPEGLAQVEAIFRESGLARVKTF
ncbi:MAG: hypothetical protein PVSMB8_11690 [Vulcanimicrobiaceae bacterium]